MTVLVALMGAPGSGKSELAGRLASELGAEVVSLDGVRERGGSGDQARFTVFAKERQVRGLLSSGRSVVLDSCLTMTGNRRRFLRAARDCGAEARLVFVSRPVEECRRVQDGREFPVPKWKVEKLHEDAEVGWVSSVDEGWDVREMVVTDASPLSSREW